MIVLEYLYINFKGSLVRQIGAMQNMSAQLQVPNIVRGKDVYA